MKRRSSGGFTSYLLAIFCIGFAAAVAWQFYGKRSSATETPVAQTAPAAVALSAPVAPSIDPAEVHQMAMDLAALRKTVAQITAGQDQMAREISRLQAANQQILAKNPEPPPPPPIAAAPAVAGRPAPGGAPPSGNTQNTAATSAGLALRASCGPDVQKLCRGISIENGDVIKCLSSHHMGELSPTCIAYFREMPGSALPKPTQNRYPKSPSAPAEAKILPNWILHDVRRGHALVENSHGDVFEITGDSTLPGLGRVEGIKRQDGQWVVVTARGLITSAPPDGF